MMEIKYEKLRENDWMKGTLVSPFLRLASLGCIAYDNSRNQRGEYI